MESADRVCDDARCTDGSCAFEHGNAACSPAGLCLCLCIVPVMHVALTLHVLIPAPPVVGEWVKDAATQRWLLVGYKNLLLSRTCN